MADWRKKAEDESRKAYEKMGGDPDKYVPADDDSNSDRKKFGCLSIILFLIATSALFILLN